DKPSKYGGLIAVVDSDRRPIGIIRSSSADQTYSETAKRHLISDFIQLQLDSPLAPVLPQLSGHATAALVVNEEGRFIGAVTAHSVVRALQAQ
ncbi:CBS domain-containing protein, partial [Paracoccus sp. PXZ]